MSSVWMTKENHFRYYYGGKPFADRRRDSGPYGISFGQIRRDPLDFRSECVMAAREISQIAKKDLTICLSGGLDSEIVALSCYQARIPFTCAIMRFENDLNLHDITWAIKLCEKLQLPYRFIDLNFSEFSSSAEFHEIALESQCLAPLVTAQIKLFKDLCQAGDFPVTGSSEIIFKKRQNQWGFFHQELIGSLFRYQHQNQLQCQAGFFYWSPELLASFVLDPLMQKEIFTSKRPEVTLSSDVKHELYSNHFQVESRPKYRGYEKMVDLNEKLKADLAQRIRITDEIWIPLDKFSQMLLGTKS